MDDRKLTKVILAGAIGCTGPVGILAVAGWCGYELWTGGTEARAQKKKQKREDQLYERGKREQEEARARAKVEDEVRHRRQLEKMAMEAKNPKPPAPPPPSKEELIKQAKQEYEAAMMEAMQIPDEVVKLSMADVAQGRFRQKMARLM